MILAYGLNKAIDNRRVIMQDPMQRCGSMEIIPMSQVLDDWVILEYGLDEAMDNR